MITQVKATIVCDGIQIRRTINSEDIMFETWCARCQMEGSLDDPMFKHMIAKCRRCGGILEYTLLINLSCADENQRPDEESGSQAVGQ